MLKATTTWITHPLSQLFLIPVPPLLAREAEDHFRSPSPQVSHVDLSEFFSRCLIFLHQQLRTEPKALCLYVCAPYVFLVPAEVKEILKLSGIVVMWVFWKSGEVSSCWDIPSGPQSSTFYTIIMPFWLLQTITLLLERLLQEYVWL